MRDVVVFVSREAKFVVRTAASAKPMHVHNTARKDSILFILCIVIMISKNVILGQVVFTQKINKKSRNYAG